MLVMPRLAWPSWRWMTLSGTPSRAISTAWAWRSWCGAKRRLIPASTARSRSVVRTAEGDHGRPRVGPSMTHSSAPTGTPTRSSSHGSSSLPAPTVHADFAVLVALAVTDEHAAARVVEVALGQGERLTDPQSRGQ